MNLVITLKSVNHNIDSSQQNQSQIDNQNTCMKIKVNAKIYTVNGIYGAMHGNILCVIDNINEEHDFESIEDFKQEVDKSFNDFIINQNTNLNNSPINWRLGSHEETLKYVQAYAKEYAQSEHYKEMTLLLEKYGNSKHMQYDAEIKNIIENELKQYLEEFNKYMIAKMNICIALETAIIKQSNT